ncbi:MAG TPA: hypothetical protein V6D12_04965 [Candidatus Obscuribacterales bacterium]
MKFPQSLAMPAQKLPSTVDNLLLSVNAPMSDYHKYLATTPL